MASAESVLSRTDAVSSAASEFWQRPLDTALADAGSDNSGLTSAEAERRLVQYGANNAAAPPAAPSMASVRGPLQKSLDHHPAGSECPVSGNW